MIKKSIVIVEDDPGLQKQLTLVLATVKDFECRYCVSTGEEALKKIPADPPDIVLMDIMLPGMSGIECVARLKKACPGLEIIILTIYEDSESIFRALKAGASGYLLKSSPPKALFQAIRDIYAGGAPFCSNIARKMIQYLQSSDQSPPKTEPLSAREKEVIEMLSQGYLYKEISDKLNITYETVRTYVKRICVKMHARSRIEAVAKYQH
ncbi:MAG: response regulator transcription factor [Verrucomicrobiales bacterium]|jgi:DNA-binding NarL/FixJ family response regulator|nr:response regulator transcription factor [Verrucomicrobiales bacterium]